MSRARLLFEALPPLATAAACFLAERVSQSTVLQELRVTSEALDRERQALAAERAYSRALEEQLDEMRGQRNGYILEWEKLREEVEALKKPVKPPPKGGKPMPPKKPPKKPY